MDVVVQVSSPGLAAAALGALMFCNTSVSEVLLQPLVVCHFEPVRSGRVCIGCECVDTVDDIAVTARRHSKITEITACMIPRSVRGHAVLRASQSDWRPGIGNGGSISVAP